MATQRKSTARQKNVKAKAQQKSATRKMIIYFVAVVLLFFAATRLGVFGVTLYNLVRLLVGSTAYVLMALILAYMVVSLVKKEWLTRRRIIGVLLIYLGIMVIIEGAFAAAHGNDNALWYVIDDMAKFHVTKFAGAGFIGWFLYIPFETLFSTVGVYIVGTLSVIVGIFVAISGLTDKLRQNLQLSAAKRQQVRADRKAEQEKVAADKEKLVEEPQQPMLSEEEFEPTYSEEMLDLPQQNFENYDYQEKPVSRYGALMTDQNADWNDIYQPAPDDVAIDNDFSDEPIIPQFGYNDVDEFDEEDIAAETAVRPADSFSGAYQLPTSQLLTAIAPADQSREFTLVKQNSQILEDTLRSFKISAQVVSSVVGPSVTKYELKLATGVRVNRIANLSDDLALALAARDVRIEAPIPGKSLVGVEIPNSEVATVGFRDMWEHAKTSPDKLLEVPLGKALDGSIRVFDLAKMPHLLVAGATGSGKSVAVNGIITSILMKALPSQVKFVMVDPKMVELSVYNDIPHLLTPVVTNPRKASRALQKVVDEMEDRYLLFSRFGVRNIAGYNEKVACENAKSDTKYQELPLIVVIVDELADLMMVASKEVEDAIVRLGQKARAAGIHMILATQRPSVDVISGLIKANVPSRVAFAVSSGTDSRTILDSNGAEKLLGRGDMLFKPIDENHPVRLQGAFLSDEDVEAVVDFIKTQEQADYDESFDPGEAEGDDSRSAIVTTAESGDPLFEEAKQIVIIAQKASTAQLQRALKVGFNRASDLMNELETAGIVGPAKGTTPRKVLMSPLGEFVGADE